MDELYEAAQRILNEYRQQHILNGAEYHPIVWPELAAKEFELEWLVEGLWPTPRHIHLFAAHKTGKSLVSLHIAVSLATGRDAFTGESIPTHVVTYIDREMTEQDLQERLFDMGLHNEMEDGTLDNLKYHLYPNIGFLDTPEGANNLWQIVERDGSDVVILDTLARVVRGDENSNDTYRNFYNCTGAMLKAHNVALMRLDHEGHQPGHSRGASSKADDVDLVYRLKTVEGGWVLEMQLSRVAYVRKTLTIAMGTDLLTFTSRDTQAYPAGTLDKVKELDSLDCPEGLSVRKTADWLRNNGHSKGRNDVLSAAIKFRNNRVDIPGLQ